MPAIYHAESITMEERPSPLDAFRWHTSPDLASMAGATNLRLNLRSLDPGRYSYPYHFHHQAEEAFIVLEGEMTLRTPEGFSVLRPGDIAIFEKGPTSAHQLHNHSAAPCRYIDLVATTGGDVVEYPDTGKVAIGALRLILDSAQKRGYYDDEEHVADHWPATGGAEVSST